MANLTIHLNHECNLDCSFCCQKGKAQKPVDHQAVLAAITNFTEPIAHVSLTGGEPLLEKAFLRDIFDTLSSKCSSFSLNTNGHLLDTETVALLNAHKVKTVVSLQGLTGEKSLETIPSANAWVALLNTIDNLYIGHVATQAFNCQTLLALHATFKAKVSVSLDITQPCTDEDISRFELQLRLLSTADPTSPSWIVFRHHKSCEYNDFTINTDGTLEKTCQYVPELGNICRGYLGIMSFSSYLKHLDFIHEFEHNLGKEELIPTVQVLTNLSCNLDCSYCYENKTAEINDLGRVQTYLLTKFKMLKGNKVIVDLIGGESLLYPDFCDSILNYALTLGNKYGKQVTISVTTNGTTLKNLKVRELIAKYRAHIHVGVSIDGTKENHDKCRVYADGRGSYDDAVANLPFLFGTLCKDHIGVKATFTTETFKNSFAEGMINLINLGFKDLAGNIIFEEVLPKVLAPTLATEFKKVIDYLFEHNLEKEVKLFQLGDYSMISTYMPGHMQEPNRSWCGTSEHMSCIGIDGKIYGCNRFCTMNKPNMHIGEIEDGALIITNQGLYDETTMFKTEWEGDCVSCNIKGDCPSCVAATYEVADRLAYIRENRMCGWTHAIALARLHFRLKIIEKDKQISALLAKS